ncbi:MAG: hypothetical protein R2792_01635 [Saprospiraceae bacterium]
MASEFLLTKPDLFTRYIIVSPGFQVGQPVATALCSRLMLQHL